MPTTENVDSLESVKSVEQLKIEIMERVKQLVQRYHYGVTLHLSDSKGTPCFSFSSGSLELMEEIPATIAPHTQVQLVHGQDQKKGPNPSETHVKLCPDKNGFQMAQELAIKRLTVTSHNETDITLQILDDEAAFIFARTFRDRNTVKKVTIQGKDEKGVRTCMSSKGLSYILPTMTGLESVKLNNLKIGMEEAVLLVTHLSPYLINLDLWDNHIDDETALYLSEYISRNLNILKTFSLGNNDIGGSTKLQIKKIFKDSGVEVDLY